MDKNKKINCNSLNKLLEHKITPSLFIGAGFSRRYLNEYPSWFSLIQSIANTIGISNHQLNSRKQKIQREYPEITDGKLYQKLCTQMEEEFLEKIANNDIDLTLIFTEEELNSVIQYNFSYLKLLVCKILKNYQLKKSPSYLRTELELFKKLKTKLFNIITTNFDTFIEDLFENQFTTMISQSDYFFNNTMNVCELYKIHGSITEPNSIILTEEDYNHFNKNRFLTSAKLISLFCDHPVIFLGYSLNDENIKLLMENIIYCLDEKKLKQLTKNLIFIEWKQHEIHMISNIKQFKLNSKSVSITYIQTDNFTRLFEYLNEFHPSASALEIRKLYSLIKDLVKTNNPSLTQLVNDMNLRDDDNCIAIDTDPKNKKPPLNGVSIDKFIKQVLDQDVVYDTDEVINWYSELRSVSFDYFIPIFYYLKNYQNDLPENIKGLIEHKEEQYTKFLGKLKKPIDIKDLTTFLTDNSVHFLNKINNLIYFYSINQINYTLCLEFLKKYYQTTFRTRDYTHFKRLLTYLDFKIFIDKRNKANSYASHNEPS